ncbi:MAG TPA: MurR/RpiR family transcriptional regulator, partial [Devosia sp.]|nr:MurR/RpiR family transcriptional regulator [Devosia sp.]
MNDVVSPASAISVALKRMEPSFTSAERRIARVLAAGFPASGLVTVAELGRKSGASSATISRFVAKLGFRSYQDFQESLRSEVRDRLESPQARFPGAQAPADIADYAAWAATLMSEVGGAVNASEFEATVELLADPRRRVNLLGGRFSHSLAQLFAFGLRGLRKDVRVLSETPQMLVDAALELGRRDVIVLFDFRRYQENIVRFAEVVAETDATLVVFTDRWMSPASLNARYVFSLPVASPSIYDSALAPLMCVEAVVASLARRLGQTAEK